MFERSEVIINSNVYFAVNCFYFILALKSQNLSNGVPDTLPVCTPNVSSSHGTVETTTQLSNNQLTLPAHHSESIPQLEEGCEELEERLLDGALRNLQYFPQLLKEVQRQKQGRRKPSVLC